MKLYTLRQWNESDLDALVKYANAPEVARNLTDGFPHPYLREHGVKFIQNAISQNPVLIFCIEVDGEAAGGIGLHLQNDIQRMNAELGYWLAVPHWGKGIMTLAIKDIVDYGFRTLPVNRIFARPFGSNKASQRVLEKAGFKLEGRFEKTLIKNGIEEDELFYAVRKRNV